jgi:copper(I)-binding protein
MKILVLSLLAGLASGPALACGDLVISDAWVRAAPPTASVMAGYLTLGNGSQEPVTLTAVASPSFERVEMHDMTHENGVMRMRKLDQIEIAAGAKAELAPGGRHLMLIQPKGAFAVGDEIEVTLTLCGEHAQVVKLPVREAGG